MKTAPKKTVKLSKKQRILIVIAGAIVILFGGWALGEFMPKPLGDRLEYLGKENYGGWFIKHYSVYYYGTDMTAEEVAEYFSKAKLLNPIENETKYRQLLSFKKGSGSNTFYISYYTDSPQNNLRFTSDKKAIVSVSSSDYELAKSSLRWPGR